jgi:hypothetical protein
MSEKANPLLELPRLVEVLDPNARVIEGISKISGKPYAFKAQDAWLYSSKSPHPIKFDVSSNPSDPILNVGFYSMSNEVIDINRQGRIGVQQVDLNPLSDTDLALYNKARKISA